MDSFWRIIKGLTVTCFCIFILTSYVGTIDEVYLVRQYVEMTPGYTPKPLVIGENTYSILCGGWSKGDKYSTLPPEREGYVFLPSLSDNLDGTFESNDVYLTLYYTKAPLI